MMASGFYTRHHLGTVVCAVVCALTYVNVLLGACLGSKESWDDHTNRVNISQATFVFPLWSQAFHATSECHLAERLSCSLRTHLVCGLCLCPDHL